MDIEIKPMKFLTGKNEVISGHLVIYEEAPEDCDCVKIEANVDSLSFSFFDDNYFSTLNLLRKSLEKNKLQILCNGSAKSVYPSRMQENSTKAYHMTVGRQAMTSDIVDIFDCDDSLEFVTVEEQQLFYEDWLKSLKK